MAQWVAFTTNLNRDGQEQFPVFMTGENPERDERHLLEFVAYQGWLMGNKPSTIHGKLTGIRWHHLNNGLKNPCGDKFRLEAIIKSLKKIRGESTGKGPVTPDQLRHLKAKMNFRNPRHIVAWAAVAQGFFLCMRTSEYLAEGYTLDATRSPTTGKIMPHCNDIPLESCDFDLADSLTAIFELSKTDQNRVGCSRSVFATGGDLCPVEAYKALRRLRINNWKPGEAAMEDGSGWVMNRDVMTSVLKATAIATLVWRVRTLRRTRYVSEARLRWRLLASIRMMRFAASCGGSLIVGAGTFMQCVKRSQRSSSGYVPGPH